MQMKGMITFEGKVTAKSAITVSYPGYKQRIPRTQHGEACIYPSTLRGALRKCLYKELRSMLANSQSISEQGIFSLADAYMLGEGYDITREVNNDPKNAAMPLAEATLRKLNPALSLMGRWRLSGMLNIIPLLADEKCIMQFGTRVRKDMFETDFGEAAYLSGNDQNLLSQLNAEDTETVEAVKPYKAKIAALNKQRRSATPEEMQSIYAQIDEAQKTIKEIKSQKIGNEETLAHLVDSYEAISPGTELRSLISIISGTENDLGLFLRTLARFSHNPSIGGHRTESGLVEMEYTVRYRGPNEDKPTVIGTVKIDIINGCQIEGDMLVDAMKLFEARITEFDFKLATLMQADEKANTK